jgi:hypothetical protein
MHNANLSDEFSKQEAGIVQLLKAVEPYGDLVEQDYQQLAGCLAEFRRDAKATSEENRKLRVGIVGQVKAGKSSLLNALLFEGTDVLPKAATPMTAALTVIRYDTKTWAEVEFYSVDDWKKVTQASEVYWERYREAEQTLLQQRKSRPLCASAAPPSPVEIIRCAGITEELKVARELVDGVTPEVAGKIGAANLAIRDVADPLQLTARLEEYIGAGGKYTSLVKSSVIYYNHEHLRDLEIVDTPGLNDPVLSRGARTREYLGQCDVVFLLIKCERFPDESDMQLLLGNIPSKGIKDILIIGSQFDDVLSGEAARYDSIKQLIANLVRGYRGELLGLLEEKLEHCSGDNEREIFNRIKSACQKEEGADRVASPVFISAMAYKASRHYENPDKYERHCIDSLNDLYPDFKVDAGLLMKLSNIPAVNRALEQHRDRKEEILQGRLAEILKQAAPRFATLKAELSSVVQTKIDTLGKVELKDIAEKERKILSRINRGRNGVEEAFDRVIVPIKSKFVTLVSDMKVLSREFRTLKERTEQGTEQYDVEIPRRFCGFNVSGVFGYRTETRNRTVTRRYAEAQEAIEGVNDFTCEVERKLIDDLKGMVNIEQLRVDLLKAAEHFVDKFDDSGQTDIEEDIIRPIERIVRKISVPEVDFGSDGRYVAAITARFSGKVGENDVDSLRSAKNEALTEVIRDLDAKLRSKTQEIEASLENSKSEFVDTLIRDIQQDLEHYRTMLADKKKSLQRLEQLKAAIAVF